MSALEATRDRTVDALGRHFALGHLSEATLEHRIRAALVARTPADLHDLTWDLPAIGPSLRDRVRSLFRRAAEHRACTRISFPGLELTLALRAAPRTWSLGRSPDCDVVLCDPGV
jgi:hypothetical protein